MRLRRTLAILFLGQSMLFGAVYSSNALMQTLEILPQAPSEGYYIITDGSTDTLYLDGESVCTLTRSGDTEIRSDASGVTTRVFDGDRLVSVTGPDGEEKRYEYSDDGILERVELLEGVGEQPPDVEQQKDRDGGRDAWQRDIDSLLPACDAIQLRRFI